MTLKELYEKLGTLNAARRQLIDAADQRAGGHGKGVLTQEENEQFDKIDADINATEAAIADHKATQNRRDQVERTERQLAESAGRRTAAQAPERPAERGRESAEEPATLEYRGRSIPLQAGTQEHVRASAEYQQRFLVYLTTGVNAGLMVGRDPKGGYLAPMMTSMSIIQAVDDLLFFRQLANVLPPLTVGSSLGIPTLDTDLADADWTSEIPAADLSEDDALTLGKRELRPHSATKLVKISNKLMRSAVIDPETLLRQRIAYKVAVTQEKAFLSGDGIEKPLGVFVASDDGIPTSRDVSCASTTELDADSVLDFYGSLKVQYLRNATAIYHRNTITRIRKLKDGNGQYLWIPGLAGNPSTICDRPYYMSEFAPNTYTAGQYVGILADFKSGYQIVDSLQLSIQVLDQLFALRNQTGLKAEFETDGAPVLAEAFSRLQLHS